MLLTRAALRPSADRAWVWALIALASLAIAALRGGRV